MSDESLPPEDVNVSRGSSTSGKLQEEYEELLKHATIGPRYDKEFLLQSVAKQREEYLQSLLQDEVAQEHARPPVITVSDQDFIGIGSKHLIKPSLKDRTSISKPVQPDQLQSQETYAKDIYRERKRGRKSVDQRKKGYEDDGEGESSFEEYSSRSPISESVTYEESGSTVKVSSKDLYDNEREVNRMDGLLDKWLHDLKQKILAEMRVSCNSVSQHYLKQLGNIAQAANRELQKVKEDRTNDVELIETYKKSNQNKDQIIENLSQRIQKEKKLEQLTGSTFYKWKALLDNLKKEKYAESFAKRHYNNVLKKKTFNAWKHVVEKRWKAKVEEACQAKAKEVCVEISSDYEKTVKALMSQLEISTQTVINLQKEKQSDEENMRKAFLRGVCALNLETMTAFQGNQ